MIQGRHREATRTITTCIHPHHHTIICIRLQPCLLLLGPIPLPVLPLLPVRTRRICPLGARWACRPVQVHSLRPPYLRTIMLTVQRARPLWDGLGAVRRRARIRPLPSVHRILLRAVPRRGLRPRKKRSGMGTRWPLLNSRGKRRLISVKSRTWDRFGCHPSRLGLGDEATSTSITVIITTDMNWTSRFETRARAGILDSTQRHSARRGGLRVQHRCACHIHEV